jgi:poly(hydroxyalkanoate) depolymerase family esterase
MASWPDQPIHTRKDPGLASWLQRCWQTIRRQVGTARPRTPPRSHRPPAATPAAQPPPDLRTDPLPPSTQTIAARSEPAAASGSSASSLSPSSSSSWSKHLFAWDEDSHPYLLFVPSQATPAPQPLVVMLHGCQQDAADFAAGTGMNPLAEQLGCLVLYPEQLAKANPMRCWNWFDKAHQGHAGEPAMIAALTRQVAQAHGADPQRIYIAGLSAGGAMAAVVAALYPEVFSALGVHSGLPAGAANDVMSAFSAMRRGGQTTRAFAGQREGLMPTIVFHGSADSTVHPDNSEHLVALALQALQATGLALTRTELPLPSPAKNSQARPAQRVRWLDADGKSYLEYWSVDEGLHAWSGGQQGGSFTDPHGPDASAAMLEFFLQHRRL